jgi:hypothetical protein
VTTIAASTVYNSIACDLQFTYGGHTKFKGGTKVLTLENQLVQDMFGVKKAHIGFSGNADVWGQVVSWFSDPTGKPPACKKIEFLMLTDKKQIYHGSSLSNWMLIPEKHFAIGSGCNFAMGAMTSGQTPLEAVKTASKHDVMTGMGFKDYTF